MGKKKKPSRHLTDELEQEARDSALPNLVRMESEELSRPDDYRFLDSETAGAEPVVMVLIFPDVLRCQCEWPDQTVNTFGPRPLIRCEQAPTVVAFQKQEPGDTTPTGAISLCADHQILIEHMYPGQCYFREITAEKKIGGIV